MPWYQRWRNVFRSEKLNNELDDEFRYHLAETVDRLTAQGMTGEEARHQADPRLRVVYLQGRRPSGQA